MRMLIIAIMMAESQLNPQVQDGKAGEKGIMQITEICIKDVNRIYDMDYVHEDAYNPLKSVAIFCMYVGYYATYERLGHAPTNEDRARIWNEGPDGWLKGESLEYWETVSDYQDHAEEYEERFVEVMK